MKASKKAKENMKIMNSVAAGIKIPITINVHPRIFIGRTDQAVFRRNSDTKAAAAISALSFSIPFGLRNCEILKTLMPLSAHSKA